MQLADSTASRTFAEAYQDIQAIVAQNDLMRQATAFYSAFLDHLPEDEQRNEVIRIIRECNDIGLFIGCVCYLAHDPYYQGVTLREVCYATPT